MPYRKHVKAGVGTVEASIRAALKEHRHGLTVQTLRLMISTSKKSIDEVVESMPDTYIDSWAAGDGEWVPVWCVVDVPEDCPMPKGKPA